MKEKTIKEIVEDRFNNLPEINQTTENYEDILMDEINKEIAIYRAERKIWKSLIKNRICFKIGDTLFQSVFIIEIIFK